MESSTAPASPPSVETGKISPSAQVEAVLVAHIADVDFHGDYNENEDRLIIKPGVDRGGQAILFPEKFWGASTEEAAKHVNGRVEVMLVLVEVGEGTYQIIDWNPVSPS